MKVTLIPSDHVAKVWPVIVPFMERAAEYTYGRYTVDDIFEALEQYDHDLWIAFTSKEDVKGAVVTTFKYYPRKKYLDMVFVGGTEGLEWKTPMLGLLQKWAFDNQCDGIESAGRAGWSRVFKDDGYKPLWSKYELPLLGVGLGE